MSNFLFQVIVDNNGLKKCSPCWQLSYDLSVIDDWTEYISRYENQNFSIRDSHFSMSGLPVQFGIPFVYFSNE